MGVAGIAGGASAPPWRVGGASFLHCRVVATSYLCFVFAVHQLVCFQMIVSSESLFTVLTSVWLVLFMNLFVFFQTTKTQTIQIADPTDVCSFLYLF